MKTIAKRLFATVIALALMCTMVTGFAANTASVTKIEILSDAETVIDTPYDISIPEKSNLNEVDINVAEGQIIKVTAMLTNEEQVALDKGDLTFLSRIVSEAGLSNDTIHYVAQATVNAEGKATFTFRPRTSVGYGAAVAKVGGTDVAAAVAFDYDVVAALVPLSLSAANPGSIVENDDKTDITFTVTNYAGGAVEVAIGENVLTEEQYTLVDNVLTIKNAAITKTVGTHTVTLSGAGYLSAESTFVVNEKPDVQLTLEAIRGTVQENASENIEFTIGGYTEGDLAVTFTKNGETVDVEYEIKGNILTIKTKIVGEYTVAVDGEGYIADEATFTITAKPDDELTLSAASPTSIEVDDNDTDIKFELDGVVDGQAITVAIGEKVLAVDTEYKYVDGILTILNAAITKEIAKYTVTVSGAGYKAATATFDVVADSSVQLTLEGLSTSIQEDNVVDGITYSISGYNAEKSITVEIDDAAVDAQYVSVEGTTLTIANGGLVKTLGTHNVKVSGNGYYAATATYTVTKKPATPDDPIVDEDKADNAQDVVNGLDFVITNNKVVLNNEINIAPEGEEEFVVQLTNTVDTKDDPALTYVEATGEIIYNPAAVGRPFVSKATVKVSVTSTPDIAKTETIYFIPAGTKIAFGNVTAIAAADGTDAFNEANFANLDKNAGDVLAAQAEALNVVLGRKDKSKIAQQKETLDYDQSGTITLSEYKIFRYMMLGKPGYSWNDVQSVRGNWIEINGVK